MQQPGAMQPGAMQHQMMQPGAPMQHQMMQPGAPMQHQQWAAQPAAQPNRRTKLFIAAGGGLAVGIVVVLLIWLLR